MRIAVVGPLGLPFTSGGISRHCAELYPRLVRLGHEVTSFGRSAHSGPAGDYDGVRLVRVPVAGGALETPGYALLASALAARPLFDVVHVHGTVASGFSWLPRLAGRAIAFTVHSADHEHPKWGRAARAFLRWSERSTIGRATVVIAVSEVLADGLRRRYPGVDVHVVPNGVTPPPPGDQAALVGLELGRYLLFVGRLVPEKGVHVLLDAYGSFRDRHPDVQLAIVGSSRDRAYVHGLETRAPDGVRFLGQRGGDELGALYHAAAAVVVPSTHEGFGLTAAEALSCGRCVVASDIPAHREVLASDALYAPPGDAAALAAAIARAVDEPAVAAELGSRGAERIRSDPGYSWDRVASDVDGLLRTI